MWQQQVDTASNHPFKCGKPGGKFREKAGAGRRPEKTPASVRDPAIARPQPWPA